MKRITQADARRYKQRVDELEAILTKQYSTWSHDWPGGVHIATALNVSTDVHSSIKTARRLYHAVVAIQTSDNQVLFYGLPLPVMP